MKRRPEQRLEQRTWAGLSLDVDAPSSIQADSGKRASAGPAMEASSSCGGTSAADSCPNCIKLASAFEEQKALCEALNARNFNLAALNSNLIMRLNTLQSAGGPVALTAPLDSLHLRICLPEEHAMMLPSSPEDGEKDAPVPMLHMWVDPIMNLQAICESMHSFVATPPGQHWQLSRTQGGDLIGGTETPRTLQLLEGAMLYASYDSIETG